MGAHDALGAEVMTSSRLFPRSFSRVVELKAPLRYTWRQGALRYLLVLDLEGKDEIIEFPVIILDAACGKELCRFQRYVRPVNLFHGCAINTESLAVPFTDVLRDFDVWLLQ